MPSRHSLPLLLAVLLLGFAASAGVARTVKSSARAQNGPQVVSRGLASITIDWTSSSTPGIRYGVYRDGVRVAWATGGPYTYYMLTCQTTYRLGVRAFIRSQKSADLGTISASTAPCTAPGGSGTTTSAGGGPPAPTTTGTTTTVTATTTTTTTTTATTATTASTPPPAGANVWLSVSGSDQTCVRGNASLPCASFNRAYQIAAPGDTVAVAAGKYPTSDPSAGATTIYPDASKEGSSAPVTFVAQGGDVTFAAPVFAFYPGVNNIVMRGSGFHFHIPTFGYGGYSARTHDVTLDGVHMDSFEVVGAANITIKNSEVGPLDSCYAPGTTSAPTSAWCDPSSPVEAYWATQPGGTTGKQAEPFIHNGSAGTATNITLQGDHIHGLQTKDGSANGLHTGGLLVWNVDGLILRGNIWDHNAIYDVESAETGTLNNVTIENNVFGWPVYPLDPSQPNPGGETAKDWRELNLGSNGLPYSNWLIRYNSFAHGTVLNGTYTNVRVVANILGTNSANAATGIAQDHNVGVAGGPSYGGLAVAQSPYQSYGGLDFQLVAGSAARSYVPGTTADQQLGTDIAGSTRSSPSDAGAY